MPCGPRHKLSEPASQPKTKTSQVYGPPVNQPVKPQTRASPRNRAADQAELSRDDGPPNRPNLFAPVYTPLPFFFFFYPDLTRGTHLSVTQCY